MLVIYQGYRGAGIINGKCVAYNIVTGKLKATPLNIGCLNISDYFLLSFCVLSPVCGLIYYFYAKIDNPAEELGEAWERMNKRDNESKNLTRQKNNVILNFAVIFRKNIFEAQKLKEFGYKFELTKEIIRDEKQLKLMLDKDLFYEVKT